VCQDVCPWNRHAPVTAEHTFLAAGLPQLTEMAALDEAAYRARLGRSPLRRARRQGLARNAAVALGNAGARGGGAVASLARALDDEAPEVRGHAAWALGRIGGRAARRALDRARARETDGAVSTEIEAARARLGERGSDDGDRSRP
jgi:epoxyqueuosine reductase